MIEGDHIIAIVINFICTSQFVTGVLTGYAILFTITLISDKQEERKLNEKR